MDWGTPHLCLRQDNPIDQIDMSYLPWARGTDMRILKESRVGGSGSSPAKHTKNSGNAVDIAVPPETAEVIARASGLQIKYGLISQFAFPPQKGGAYTRSDLGSMWDGADEPQQRTARR
ncbi:MULTISPECIES: hypothetical protein [unclassified Janthinobacterium]|uniref:hypothetical protein n=1 Tax=unclassified Janthinobacterium TaxID=2610881 RepID=UPI001E4EC1FF|nr:MULTISPECIES: hypothetical protein [unclassified Janthinobacterium]MCC7643745.1 hypothetical protein [Janthinobacterium sp. EB271-G4-3-1]MCC7691056.1 hypothetical protein [Janthinobacterium sp. EB271-G4-3-2]